MKALEYVIATISFLALSIDGVNCTNEAPEPEPWIDDPERCLATDDCMMLDTVCEQWADAVAMKVDVDCHVGTYGENYTEIFDQCCNGNLCYGRWTYMVDQESLDQCIHDYWMTPCHEESPESCSYIEAQ